MKRFNIGYLALLILNLICVRIDAATATFTPSSDIGGADNFTVTVTWDDSLACQGSTTTILFNIKRDGDVDDDVYPVRLQGFVPIINGFACPTVIPPSPLGFTPGGFFDPTASPGDFGLNLCDACGDNLGVWQLAQPFPAISDGFDMSVTVTLTECGTLIYQPCFTYNIGFANFTECVAEITFTVVPHAVLQNITEQAICQGSTFTGTLLPPICTAQAGYQCPNCIPCTACANFSASSGFTGCNACSGISGCVCPCTACSGYTGCPPCTSCVPCPGCTACAGYTGPCGDGQPFHFTLSSASGGSVSLLDPSGSTYVFTPDPNFFGTASFLYNVVSDWNPIIFCPAFTGGLVQIPYAQNPVASDVTLTGCAGQGLSGSLAAFVTGGSGSYVFSQTGPISCGSVTVNPNGFFLYTAPTGPATVCAFGYAATDTAGPNCVGTGVVTVTVNELPTAENQTINTCVNQPVSGNVTATGGTPQYTFTLGTGPTNGTLTSPIDPNTGAFTYTPNLNFVGTDSFTFIVTDSNGCISDPAGTITINVNPVPVSSSTAINGCINTNLTGTLVPLVTGGTGALSFSGPSSQPSCGGVFVQSDGSFTFSPNFGFTGQCCFDYFANQGGCPATGPHTVCVNVQPGPIATGSVFNVCPSGTVTGNLFDNIISATPPIEFDLVGTGINGTIDIFDATGGNFQFTPTIASGVAGFNFQVDDAFPCPSATQMITVIVRPKPTTTTGTILACDNAPANGNLNPQVMGNPPFTFTGPFSEAGGTTVINSNGTFTFTPTPGATGGSFTYEVSSVFGCTGSGTELVIINPAPDATGATGVVCANSKLTGDLVPLVTGGTPPYVSFQSVPPTINGTVMISSTGIYMFTPNAGATFGSFNYKVTDSKGCMDTATVDISINPGPTANTGNFTGCEGDIFGSLSSLVSGNAPFTFTAPVGPVVNGTVMLLDVTTGDFVFTPSILPPGQGRFNYQVTDSSNPPCTSPVTPVFINIVEGPVALPANFTGCENQPFSGSLAPFATCGVPPFEFFFTGEIPPCASGIIIEPDGDIIFFPAIDFTGPCQFTYCVEDTTPCISCSTVTINVQPSPVASDSGPFTGCVNNPFSGDLNNFMISGTPPFSFTGGNEINGALDLLVTGPFTFTPAAIGFASFDYSAVDFYGCQSNTGTISFNVQESPTIVGTSPLDTCQDTPVTGNVTAAASPGLFPLVFSIVPDSEVGGTTILVPTSPTTADFTFTPNVVDFPMPTVVGSVTIRVTASNGCFADFPVTINIHQTPIAGSTGLGSCSPVFTGSLTGLVSGGVPPYIFSQFNGFIPPGCGNVVISPFGDFVFTAGGTGPCTFFYQVTESSVSSCTATGAVTITTSVPPVVDDAFFCTCSNVPFTINLNTLVSGGVPPYTFAIVGVPVGGMVFLNPITGLATFKPNPGFNGIASFQFQAFDSFDPACASNIGTVTISVPCC